jgi:chemotaxis family two-component system response regulator PixH
MSTALVVEDSLVEREAIAFSLHESGFHVLTAENGEEAKAKLSSYQPDIVILDVVLPGSSGFEICRELKANPKTSRIPVIFCSSKGTKLDKFWGLKQGANAYLTKPFVPTELLDIIRQLLNNQTESVFEKSK